MPPRTKTSAFTLIELLVVIAIIAILAVVVILTLNPAQLIAQARDANRLSDMATLTNAINLYDTDQGGAQNFSLGSSSVVYVSIPDMVSTCANVGLPSGDSCASSTSSRNVDGTGWLPIDFRNISSGSPIGNLPMDPTNQTSSGLYYMYGTNGSTFELIAKMESQKYQQSVTSGLGNGIDVQGSMANEDTGPVGYWPLNEGSGTIAYDQSGNGNNGTWQGNASGTSGYYSPGLNGGWAGYFNGTTTYISYGTSITLIPSTFTLVAWINVENTNQQMILYHGLGCTAWGSYYLSVGGSENNDVPGRLAVGFHTSNNGTTELTAAPSTVSTGIWQQVVGTYNNSQLSLYVDGILVSTSTASGVPYDDGQQLYMGADPGCGGRFYLTGLINDVRIYNRALSPAEIQAIYNAEK